MRIFNKKILLICFSACLLCGIAAADEIVEMVSDPLKLVIYPKTGNFCLYHSKAEDARKYEPLYDDRSQASVNIYSVLFNGAMFHLNNKSGKKIIVSQTKDEITLTFQISLDFLASQTFSFVPSKQRSTGKILKVVTEIQNISGELADIALKAVFDTSLGEKNLIPLYTDLRSEIGAELMLQPVLEKDSVIFSADKGYACLFFLRNEYMTVPTFVYAANWERLVTKKWLPSYVSGRSFRKYTSSDPGLLYVWSERKVQNKATLSITNCIGFYDYRNTAETATGYAAYTQQTGVSVQQPIIVDQTVNKSVVTKAPDAAQPTAPAVQQAASSSQQSAPETREKAPTVQKKPVKKAPEKDYQYVKKLLDRIAELEQSPDELSTEEIRKLRTEVDNAIKAIQEE
ncbi:MAG: hypothetical protein ACTTI6_01145 [Treponema sp.]|uniref:hypothetical protein n=1 Tax=Treponema sp. TaxID=166 RepID=UPI003FA30173